MDVILKNRVRTSQGRLGFALGFLIVAGCSPAPDIVTGPQCAGFLGLECAGEAECVDNPNDNCDPAEGGSDCIGACICEAFSSCGPAEVWDSSPEVCACVPQGASCSLIECVPGNVCVEFPDGTAGCIFPDPCSGFECPEGSRCTAPADAPFCIADEEQGPTCGSTTCAGGTVCCNASCGICAPPDGVCTQQVCDPTE